MRAFGRFVAVAAALLICGSTPPRAATGGEYDLTCWPDPLYHGETLTVNLPMPHDHWEFEITTPAGRNLLMSFDPGPKDKILPVIPHDVFAKTRELRIEPANARGSPHEGYLGKCVPRVSGQPQPVFTESGRYGATAGPEIGGFPDPSPSTCDILYFSHPRPKPGERIPEREAALLRAWQLPSRRPEQTGPRKLAPIWTPRPLNCQPRELYRGDILTVELSMPHENWEFGVVRKGEDDPLLANPFLLTFKLGLADKIRPVISPHEFSKLKRVKLDTRKTRGSLAHGLSFGPCFPRVLDLPVPIFTKTGDYEVQLGPDLGDDIHHEVVATCRVHYADHPRSGR